MGHGWRSKVLRRVSPEALLRFKTEFRALQDLQHANLVRLDELISDGNQWFFTMELVEGVDFLAHVAATAPEHELAASHTLDDTEQLDGHLAAARLGLPIAAAAGYGFDEQRLRSALAQLVEGVASLHLAGKVHRDIKPSNILVTQDGRVVLLDFGVVADARRARDDHVVGTLLYMAPEQADAGAVGPPADWYAVGLVLYQALTGHLPFGASPLDALELRKRVEPPRPASVAADVPADLDQLCMDLLRIDPRDRPEDAEVLQRLSLRAADPGPRGRFVGRQRELDALGRMFSAVQQQRQAHALVIHGESGTGKSALVSKFIEQLDPVAVVFSGRCCERESVPYQAVDEVVDDLSWYLKRLPPAETAGLMPPQNSALAQLFPVLQRVPAIAQESSPIMHTAAPRELRLRAFAALRDVLANIARRHPLVVAIDDLQWADADSLALLADIVAPPAPPGLLLLATVRSPDRVARDLGDRGDSDTDGARGSPLPGAHHLELAGLPPLEARELAEALLVRAPASRDERARIAAVIAEESGGHPMFIDELVRRKLALGVQPGPLQLDEALAARIQELDANERAILEMAAIASTPLTPDVAAATTGLGHDELARRLTSLRAASLIRSAMTTAGHAVEPYHDRVRRAAIARLAPAARRGLHLQLAVALEHRGADAETLAVHFHEAGEARRAAACASVAATRAAQALAFDRAARLYRMAVAHEPPDTAEGLRLRVGLAEALTNAGRAAEAARAFEEAAITADRAMASELQQRAADQYLRGGHIDAGLAAMGRVLAPLALTLPRTPLRAFASLVIRRAQLRLRGLGYRERTAADIPAEEISRIDACYSVATGLATVDHVRGADFATRQLLLALRAGEPYRVARALAMEAGFAGSRGIRGIARAEYLLGLASALAKRLGDPYTLGLVEGAIGMFAFCTGNWRSAFEHAEQAHSIVREKLPAMTWERHTMDFLVLSSALYRGELADMARRVPPLLREADERSDRYAATNLRTAFIPFLRLAADQPLEARREGAEAARTWSRTGFYLQHYNFEVFSEGQVSIYLGEAEAAYRRIRKLWPVLRASLLTTVQLTYLEAVHVRARCALAAAATASGRARAKWLRTAERDVARMVRARAPWCRGWIDLLASGIAAERGDREAAVALANTAVQRCDAADLGLYAAAARRRLGELLGGSEGRELLTAADARMSQQGIRNPQRMTMVLAPGAVRND